VREYAVTFARSARKELEALDPPYADRVLARIEALANDARPAGARKLQGAQRLWRIRVGEYRVIYSVDDRNGMIDVVRIRHRRDVYR
jgi:mRNA interferase RelE/StbE